MPRISGILAVGMVAWGITTVAQGNTTPAGFATAQSIQDVPLPPSPSPPPPSPPPPFPEQGRGFGGPGRGGAGRGGRGGPAGFALGPVPVPASNPLTVDKVTLGRKLFSDTRLSADNSVSCATCHKPDRAFTDGRRVGRGIHQTDGARNTPSLVNAAYSPTLFWDGRAASLEEQALGPMFNPKEMGLTADEVQRRTGMPATDVANALASYVRTIRSGESRYDWFVTGQSAMFTDLERQGLDIFRGRGQCVACHGGPRFTDDQFHNTGVGWDGGRFSDEGRAGVTHDERDRGAFKTPSLRDVALTGPYMHDGSLATLEDVVEFYSRGGQRNPWLDPRLDPQYFTAEDSQALVAFLRTLSGHITEGF